MRQLFRPIDGLENGMMHRGGIICQCAPLDSARDDSADVVVWWCGGTPSPRLRSTKCGGVGCHPERSRRVQRGLTLGGVRNIQLVN